MFGNVFERRWRRHSAQETHGPAAAPFGTPSERPDSPSGPRRDTVRHTGLAAGGRLGI